MLSNIRLKSIKSYITKRMMVPFRMTYCRPAPLVCGFLLLVALLMYVFYYIFSTFFSYMHGEGISGSWVFRLSLNLLGYSTIFIPGFALFLYVKKVKVDEKHDRGFWSYLLKVFFAESDKKSYSPLESSETPSLSSSFLKDSFNLIFCSAGLLSSYLIWGLLQERIMTQIYINAQGEKDRFGNSQFLVFVNRILAFILAALAVLLTDQPRHNVPLYKYFYCSFSNIMSSWCQYEALKFISFPTQVLSKACKLIPVMIMGKIVSRRNYEYYEYVTALMICIGMVLFIYGSSDVTHDDKPGTTISGFILIVSYMAFDSFTSNWQSELFSQYSTSSLQMMLGVNFFSCLLTTVSLLQQEGFLESLMFSVKYPSFAFDCVVLSVCSAIGQIFVFYTISSFGPVVFIIIMTFRQAVAIVLSAITYHHFISFIGIVGITVVFAAIFLRIYCSHRSQNVSPSVFNFMQEIISIHIGQAGIQIGSACWELYCLEHGIWPDGFQSNQTALCNPHEISFGSFFDETDFGRYVPRAVLVDLEPSVVDEIRNNQYKYLFRPNSLVSGKEDAANNYARGYYTIGREVIKTVTEAIRREVNLCDSLDGFFFFHSMGGGTGSGLSTLILETLSEDYVKKKQLEFVVYPSPRLATATVEPYNAILSTNGSIDLTDCVFLIDNEALYNICSLKLDIEDPTYMNLNRILGQVISSLTAAMRFDGSINVDLSEFQTNLVPFPRIHFPLITYAPFLSSYRASHERITIKQVTRLCFEPSNQLLKCDTNRGKYMACVLLYRGLIPPADITTSLNIIRKSRIPFVNWCPTGFKVGINFQPPSSYPDSTISASHLALCTVANTTAISEAWARIDYKFDLMFSKRCFVHWYLGEGMDEQEFMDARENLAALEKDYFECISESPVEQSTLKTSPRGRKASSMKSLPTTTATSPGTRKTASPATRITVTPATIRSTGSSAARISASPGTRSASGGTRRTSPGPRKASPATRRASPAPKKGASPKRKSASPGKKSGSPKRPKSPKK